MTLKRAVLLVLIAQVAIAALAVNNYGFTLEGLQATTRFSGRLSLAIFSVLFIFLPRNREKLSSYFSNQPFYIFAIAHGIHLVELLTYVYLSKVDLIPIRLAGGFLAYVFIFSMPVVQYYFEQGKIPQKKYSIVENVYLYYVWFIFFMSYLPRVQGKLPNAGGSYWEFVVLLCWVCMLLGMKLTSMLNFKKPNKFMSTN
jgi:hypothetical protein